MTPQTRRHARTERGQITAMLVLFAICLLMAVSAVIDVSAAYLRRQSATSLADGAALAATEAAAASSIYGSDDDGYVALDPAAAYAAVDAYLTETGAYEHYPGLRVGVTVDGHAVRVSLDMPFELPVSMPGVADATTISATGSAALPIY